MRHRVSGIAKITQAKQREAGRSCPSALPQSKQQTGTAHKQRGGDSRAVQRQAKGSQQSNGLWCSKGRRVDQPAIKAVKIADRDDKLDCAFCPDRDRRVCNSRAVPLRVRLA